MAARTHKLYDDITTTFKEEMKKVRNNEKESAMKR